MNILQPSGAAACNVNITFSPFFNNSHKKREDSLSFLGTLSIRCQFALDESVRCLYGERSLFIWGKTLSLFFFVVHLLCLFSVVHMFSSGHDMSISFMCFMWVINVAFSIPAKCNCPMYLIIVSFGYVYFI